MYKKTAKEFNLMIKMKVILFKYLKSGIIKTPNMWKTKNLNICQYAKKTHFLCLQCLKLEKPRKVLLWKKTWT